MASIKVRVFVDQNLAGVEYVSTTHELYKKKEEFAAKYTRKSSGTVDRIGFKVSSAEPDSLYLKNPPKGLPGKPSRYPWIEDIDQWVGRGAGRRITRVPVCPRARPRK